VTFVDLLSKYLLVMELRFHAMLCFNEISDAGDMKSSHGPHLACGQHVPHS